MADVQANAKLLCQSELAILPLFPGDSKDQLQLNNWSNASFGLAEPHIGPHHTERFTNLGKLNLLMVIRF